MTDEPTDHEAEGAMRWVMRRPGEYAETRGRLHAANNALTIAQIALRRISASDTTSDIDGNHEGPLAKIADEALTAIEKAIRT